MVNLIQPSLSSKPTMELLTHGDEHHEIGDGGWLMMTMATNPPLQSPERTPNQPSGEIRAWRQLRIIKRDETFSPIFFSARRNIWSWSLGRRSLRGPTRQGAHPGGWARPHPRGQGVGPLALILSPIFLIFSKNKFHGVSGHSKNFCFCT